MDELFTRRRGIETRWASPENPRGERGAGGRANGGRKGRPSLPLGPGEAVTLAEESPGVSGTVRRLWATVDDRSPAMLRGLRLEAFWDGAKKPAISAPLGDFFGVGLGRCVPFECALFGNPEGRSFNCRIPMPFRDGMRLTLTNDSPAPLKMLFYDVNYTVGDNHPADILYFHTHFRRENPTMRGNDFAILPQVNGTGRYLGANLGVRADTARYGNLWWGEGEVKMFVDGDTDLPTLCGTGTEDYIGTAWGQGAFAHVNQGCPVADYEKMEYAFYRYHLPDPVYFQSSCRVTIQQMGGCFGEQKIWIRDRVANDGDTVYLAVPGDVPADFSGPENEFVMIEREDDWSSCAYFYLDRPENNLPALAPFAERVAGTNG